MLADTRLSSILCQAGKAVHSFGTPGSHFVRTFLAGLKGTLISAEVLLDNAVWHEGQNLAVGHDWDYSDGYQAIRQVILALPEAGT
ncbi:DUF6348 family protein [Mesorhizobium sp. C432A]|uniref:DUF6348 family protein n=1 Tax=Mesorhizobium sp. C432A TaxID=2956836 RepID=UPI00336A636F